MLPFGALPGTAAGSYLVEEKAFAIASAPRLLPALLARPAPGATGGALPDSLLLFGGIDFDAGPQRREVALPKLPAESKHLAGATLGSTVGSSLPQPGAQPMFRLLKETGPEIETIDRMFHEQRPDGTSRRFDGRTGTENSFRRFAPGSRWIHLATHGFFSDQLLVGSLAAGRGASARVGGPTPDVRRAEDRLPSAVSRIDLMSGLSLAGANKANAADEDDGILWAMEVAALDLSRTDFAVLSACETGLGKIAGGEGTLGLQRAFQTAGARTVVSTLWNVSDHVTRLLMERIYDNLFRRKMSKAAAVREAQIWMLTASRKSFEEERQVAPGEANHQSTHLPARYMLPASWAPYLLVGDWR
jgi:CHAT domain-containing protein